MPGLLKPYHYWGVFLLLLYLFSGTLSVYSQDKKDSGLSGIDSLKPVIVRPKEMRPRLRGDTMEYSTENIHVRKFANVEELLGRLPGLQIDANGDISYNGEKIQHLLVDGVDIFGGDPTLITRNLDASKIAKVQLLERRSDQAIFTGIDDGVRIKTLNLILKTEARNNYSGKVEGGGNSTGNYDIKGFGIGFQGKKQFAILGLAANTGETQFFSKPGMPGVSIADASDELGASAGTGIPQFAATTLHYANTWDGGSNHFEGNYQFSHFVTRPISSTQTIQVLSDNIYSQYQQSQSINQQYYQRYYAAYELLPNSKSTLRFSFFGNNSTGENRFTSQNSSSLNDTLVNNSQRSILDNVSRLSLSGNINWKANIGKTPGRSISITAFLSKNDNMTDGYLFSINKFYRPNGDIGNEDTVDQRKQIASHALKVNPSIGYTEPLWKGASLGVSYNFSISNNEPIQTTFDKLGDKYQIVIDSLTSHLKTAVINQSVTLNLQGKTPKFSYMVSNSWISYDYHQRNLIAGPFLHLQSRNWTPQIWLNYIVKPAVGISFKYDAFTTQPDITQLQSVRNNNDPLHISIGNPNLKPSVNHSFGLGIHWVKPFIVDLGLKLSLINDAISTRTTTDSLGKQISQAVNVDGGINTGLFFLVSKRVFGLDMSFRSAANYSRTVNYVNTNLSNNDIYNATGTFILKRYKPEKYTFNLNASVGYYDAISSINPASPTHYWTQNHSGFITVFFLQNFEINTSSVYSWQQKTNIFSKSTSVFLWNSYIGRYFLGKRFSIKIEVNNILNKNAGIARSNSTNVTTETTSNILGRYYMLSAIYHFDKNLKKTKPLSN